MDAALNTNANADLGMIAQLVTELAADQQALEVHVASASQRQIAAMEELNCKLRKELDECRSQLAANEPILQMMAEQLRMLNKRWDVDWEVPMRIEQRRNRNNFI